MKILWIIFLNFIIWAAFSKVECDHCQLHSLFLFSDLKMAWPIYWWNICNLTPPITFVLCLYWMAVEFDFKYSDDLKLIVWIVGSKIVDFIAECNQGWGRIAGHVISYDTIMFLVMGIVLANAHWQWIKTA